MGLDNNEDGNGCPETKKIVGVEEVEGWDESRKRSEGFICAAAAEDDEDEEGRKIELGPQCTLKQQFEKDKVPFFSFSFFGSNQFYSCPISNASKMVSLRMTKA